MISSIDKFLKSADNICDYIPIVSTVANLIDLFQKTVIIPLLEPSITSRSHYYKHLKNKHYSQCVFLLIPIISNVLIGIHHIAFLSMAAGSLDKFRAKPLF